MIFAKLFKDVIASIETIEDLSVDEFKDKVIECFDRYSYDGEDEVVGFEKWPELKDGKYQLPAKINHEDAYELTIHAIVKDGKISVTNVL